MSVFVSLSLSLSFFFWYESGHGKEEHMCPWVHYICDLPWKNMQKCVWCRRCGRSTAWNRSCSRKQLEKYAKSGWEAIHRGVQSEDVHGRDARTCHRYYFKNQQNVYVFPRIVKQLPASGQLRFYFKNKSINNTTLFLFVYFYDRLLGTAFQQYWPTFSDSKVTKMFIAISKNYIVSFLNAPQKQHQVYDAILNFNLCRKLFIKTKYCQSWT